MNLRKLKVLENTYDEEWVDLFSEEWEEIKTPYYFGRPGKYLLGDFCWMEVPGRSQCYKYDEDLFKYQLRLLEASRLNLRQVESLKSIIDQRLSTRKQRDLYYDAKAWEENRKLRRDTTLYFNRNIYQSSLR